jgi:hypothetical protein
MTIIWMIYDTYMTAIFNFFRGLPQHEQSPQNTVIVNPLCAEFGVIGLIQNVNG